MFEGKKAIIFDLDGTLLDTVGMYNKADSQLIIKAKGIPRDNLLQERNNFLEAAKSANKNFMDYIMYLKKSYNLMLSAEELFKFRRDWIAEQCEFLTYKPNADVFLNELKKRGFLLALATVSGRNQIEIYKHKNKNIIEKADFKEIFGENIIAREEVVNKKPDPEIYLKTVEMLGVKPEECLVIEDSLHGVKAAMRAGLEVVSIYDKYSDSDRDFINELSDYTARDYDELLEKLNSYTRKRVK